MDRSIKIILVSMVIIFQAGCVSMQHQDANTHIGMQSQTVNSEREMGWWLIQFVKDWPDGDPAPFYYDELIADQVIRPALLKYRENIMLWRVHRRAARDEVGNVFSFIFYADQESAQKIVNHVTENDMLKDMVAANLIKDVWRDDVSEISRPDIGDSSDSSWPKPVIDSWPYFIMGVSQSWFELIGELRREDVVDTENMSLEEMLDYYAGIHEEISYIWKKAGRHAYLHHASGIFAYKPVEVRY